MQVELEKDYPHYGWAPIFVNMRFIFNDIRGRISSWK